MNLILFQNYWVIGGIVFLILLIIVLATRTSLKCILCGMPNFGSFVYPDNTRTSFCKEHLVKKFQENFLKSNYKMVVIEPDFENYPGAYLYATVEKLGQWQYPKQAQDKITSLLESISDKKCEECGSVASVAYFKKEDYEVPNLEGITATPKYICKNCTTKK